MTTEDQIPSSLRATDYLLLASVCVVLFGYALVETRVLTMHEAVLPENSREMMLDHDWMVPKYGGRPWLERPPLPQWVTVAFAATVGHCDREWIVRTPPVILGIGVVLLVAWMTSLWFGRGIALLTGIILATMWEFYTYASDAEADMFLCAIVTGAMALFVYLEFRCRKDDKESVNFVGKRPWPVLAFFVLFGMTNLAKGLIFGTLMVAVPVACYLLWNFVGEPEAQARHERIPRLRFGLKVSNFRAIGGYVWLWGWLAFAAVALPWPLLMWWRDANVLELWASDYIGRLNQGFIREPVWYYLVTLPWVMLPWTFTALLGLGLTGGQAIRKRCSPERFLWCWAVWTPVVFSIPQGKHHHYLLQCLAPWAVIAALGAMKIWNWILQAPARLRNPALGLLLVALPGDLAIAFFGGKLPGPGWIMPALLVLWPIFVFTLWWGVTRTDARLAFSAVLGLLVAMYCTLYSYKTHYLDRYENDTVFLEQTRALVPNGRPLLINYDGHTLEAFRMLFYLNGNAALLHNFTYLLDERITEKELYIIARGQDAKRLAHYGTAQVIAQSKHARGERGDESPGARWTLYLVRLRDDLPRRSVADVYMRPMQASGRIPGPFLE